MPRKRTQQTETTGITTGPVLVPQEHGGALNSGGTPGNKGGGRPPNTFKNFLAQLRQDPRVQRALEQTITDPESKHYAAALRVIVDYDEEAPANLTAEERKARVLALVKEAEQRRRQA